MHFHSQLKAFWEIFPGVQNIKTTPMKRLKADIHDEHMTAFDYIVNENTITRGDGVSFKFAPLLRGRMTMLCSLQVVYLRRSEPGSVLANSDIDNKLKTIFDALSVPSPGQLPDNIDAPPDPIYVLLENDKLVTHVAVETDWLLGDLPYSDIPPLDVPNEGSDARLLITVKMEPYSAKIGILEGNIF